MIQSVHELVETRAGPDYSGTTTLYIQGDGIPPLTIVTCRMDSYFPGIIKLSCRLLLAKYVVYRILALYAGVYVRGTHDL
jgi:hypothetical protein